MAATKTVTVEIADTEVEYEAAECASCGQQHNVDEMTSVLAGEYEYYHRTSTFEFDSFPDELYFCPYCRDEPISLRLSGNYGPLLLLTCLSMFLGVMFTLMFMTV